MITTDGGLVSSSSGVNSRPIGGRSPSVWKKFSVTVARETRSGSSALERLASPCVYAATLEKLDFTHIIPGHGDVAPKAQITFLKNYLADLIAAVKKAAADRATLDEMKSKVADQLAPKYEAGMSKYWTGRYRDRIAVNIEHVHKKVVKPA